MHQLLWIISSKQKKCWYGLMCWFVDTKPSISVDILAIKQQKKPWPHITWMGTLYFSLKICLVMTKFLASWYSQYVSCSDYFKDWRGKHTISLAPVKIREKFSVSNCSSQFDFCIISVKIVSLLHRMENGACLYVNASQFCESVLAGCSKWFWFPLVRSINLPGGG